MLVQEPTDDGRLRSAATPAPPRSRATYAFLTFAAIAVLAMRHDYWFWNTPYPLMFDCLPVALWWQAVVSLSACVLMWLMVRLAWPQELEDEALAAEQLDTRGGVGGGAGDSSEG